MRQQQHKIVTAFSGSELLCPRLLLRGLAH
jgi:hypothetical protein